MDPIKAEQLSSTKWRILALPFGGPFGGKDADAEYFSPRTDPKPDWYPKVPVVFQHTKDTTLDDELLGTEDDLTKMRDGWWATMWLERSARYWAQVDTLLRRGVMHGSSGTASHLVRKAADGELLRWPHLEQSLTVTPANFLSRIVPVKTMEHFTTAGIESDALKALLDSDLPDLGPTLGDSPGGDPAMDRLAKARKDVAVQLARSRTI